MSPAFIGLGSNAGDRVQHVTEALRALGRVPQSNLARVSSLYDTDPVGDPRLPRVLNAVARLDTDLPPEALHRETARIEAEGGRGPTDRAGQRTIDLDLLYHGEQVLRRPGLEIPHPWIAERLFVLIPMLEIAPDWVDPALGIRLADLYRRRPRAASVRWFARPRW
jgi:2-amino-4-hydroxy-6-hydroxymethyldihydropteridine diphosphokinase